MSIKLDPLSPYKWAQLERNKGIRELVGRLANNARILWYHAFTTLKASEDEVPWCSSFMCAAAESCGFKSTRSAAAKSWLTYGEEIASIIEGALIFKKEVQAGDIAIFSRSGGNHVAFINSPYIKGDKLIEVLGGNQSDMISIAKYKTDKLLAIRRFH